MRPLPAKFSSLPHILRARMVSLALVGSTAVGCRPGATVLLPDRPPATLDHPIGIEPDSRVGADIPPPSPPLGVSIGSGGPLRLVAAAPDGQWIALCEGRVSTTAPRTLAWSPWLWVAGERVDVDRFVAFESSGRHVSFVREGVLALLDTAEGAMVGLRDLDSSELGAASQPWVDFDATGKHVAYFVSTDDGPRIRVRSLLGREERELDPGPLVLSSARVRLESPNGARVDVVTRSAACEDGCSDGIPAACRPTSMHAALGPTETRYVRMDSGEAAKQAPDALGIWDDGLLVRRGDGALVWRRFRDERELVDASCRGRVLHRDTLRRRLLVACPFEGAAQVREYAPSDPRGSGPDPREFEELGAFAVASLVEGEPWWVDRNRARILLANPARMVDVESVQEIVHATSRHALVRRTGDHALVDLVGGRVRPLPDLPGTPSSSVLRTDPMVAVAFDVGAWIIDLDKGGVHARLRLEPLAVTRSGHVLVSQDPEATDRGPFVWLDPVASSPPGDVGARTTRADPKHANREIGLDCSSWVGSQSRHPCSSS